MKSTASINGMAIAIVALGIGLVGCGSTSGSNNSSNKTSTTTTIGKTSTTTTTAKTQAKVAPRTTAPGPNPTIASYIQQNGITDTPVHRGDPGAPAINLPIPDGWADAGPDTPATAYWAIVDNGPEAAKYTPSIVATVSKLVGNVDQQKLLDLAPGELKNLPGFKPMGDGSTTILGRFSGLPIGRDLGARRPDKGGRAENRRNPPASDAVYLLRLNADCLDDQIGQALDRDDHHRRTDDDHRVSIFRLRGSPLFRGDEQVLPAHDAVAEVLLGECNELGVESGSEHRIVADGAVGVDRRAVMVFEVVVHSVGAVEAVDRLAFPAER